jgi:hypothetical protein
MVIFWPVICRREGDPTWQEYDAVWEKAEALKGRVSAQMGFIVRDAGIIDLGQTRPLRATWQPDPTLAEQE